MQGDDGLIGNKGGNGGNGGRGGLGGEAGKVEVYDEKNILINEKVNKFNKI